MAYNRKAYRFSYSNEFEYVWAGNYGAKGEHRAEKRKKTPKEIEYQNRWNKRKYIRRLIKLNFEDGIYVTLTYGKGQRKNMKGVKQDFKNFRDRMRRAYRKQGVDFKYIFCIEIGSRGGIHIHMILNRTPGKPETDKLIGEQWTYGHPYMTPLYQEGDYEQLACYMAKVPQEETGEDKKGRIARMEEITDDNYDYGTSRGNLIKPVPEEKEYERRTVKKLIQEGPTPTLGYYIDKSSIRTGINRFTGMSYMYYTEHLIKKKRRE